jgi:hypothetical protein
VGLTACGTTPSDRPITSTTALMPCTNAPLSVKVVDLRVTAVNTGSDACALSGRDPVEVPWWRIVGGKPTPAKGTLPPGGVLVQSYKAEGGNGCPWPGGPGGTADISVIVEGRTNVVSLPAKVVHEMTECDIVSVLSPMIQPSAPS